MQNPCCLSWAQTQVQEAAQKCVQYLVAILAVAQTEETEGSEGPVESTLST